MFAYERNQLYTKQKKRFVYRTKRFMHITTFQKMPWAIFNYFLFHAKNYQEEL